MVVKTHAYTQCTQRTPPTTHTTTTNHPPTHSHNAHNQPHTPPPPTKHPHSEGEREKRIVQALTDKGEKLATALDSSNGKKEVRRAGAS